MLGLLSFFTYRYLFIKPLDVNVVEEAGFSFLKIPDSLLPTPLSEKAHVNTLLESSNIDLALCAVSLKHSSLRYENGYYVWDLQAVRDSNLVAFKMSPEVKKVCNEDAYKCPCTEISRLESVEVCYVNPLKQEARVYVNPYYLNLPNVSNCDFTYDKSPLSPVDRKGNVVSSITLPKDSTSSDIFTVQVPITQESLGSGCFKAGLDIVKVNQMDNSLCSTSKESGFVVEGESKTPMKKAKSLDEGTFYSVTAEKVLEKEFHVACFLDLDKYSPAKSYGFSILGQDNGYIEDFVCDNSCSFEKVLDTNTDRVLMSYSYDYTFKEIGTYKIVCKNN